MQKDVAAAVFFGERDEPKEPVVVEHLHDTSEALALDEHRRRIDIFHLSTH